MTNPIGPGGWLVPRRLLPLAATRPARALARGAASLAVWARLRNGPLRLDGADVASSLDRQSRALLWRILSDAIGTIGTLAAADAPIERGLAALAGLADRIRADAATSAPPLEGAESAHLYVLEILIHDLQPCLDRWQPRCAAWRDTGRPTAEWSLGPLCRADLARTRERLVERGWQLGMGLGLPNLDRLLPPRPAMAPALAAAAELAVAEAAAVAPPDQASLQAGWRIYIEGASRLPAADHPSGPGALAAAMAALEALAAEIGAGLKSMPPPRPNGAPDTIAGLAFSLLTDTLQPFLAEWQPRYRKFAATGRPDAKWRRLAECRSALAASREDCVAKIRTLGHEIGAPSMPRPTVAPAEEDEIALQLPPPATRP